jgi:hypothetical protein
MKHNQTIKQAITEGKAYLSIDLDYWRGNNDDRGANTFFNKVFEHADLNNIEILFVESHDQLHHHIDTFVGHIDSFVGSAQTKCERVKVINVDYHSDVSDDPLWNFQEGTWANYIRFKEYLDFVWYHPKASYYDIKKGYCHATRNPFKDNTEMSKRGGDKIRAAMFRSITKKAGLPNIGSDIQYIGVALSPSWSVPRTIRRVLQEFVVRGIALHTLPGASSAKGFDCLKHEYIPQKMQKEELL